MSAIAVIVIAIVVVLLVLAVGVFVVDRPPARRRRGDGRALARDPQARPQRRRPATTIEARRRRPAGRSSGRGGGRALGGARDGRRPTRAGAVRAARPRDARRHPPPVLQPRHRRAASASAWPASAPPCSPSCGRSSSGGFGSQDQRRQARRRRSPRSTQDKGFFYVPEGRMWVTEYPADALPKAEKVYAGAVLDRHGGRHRRAVPEVRAPRLPRAVLHDLAVVRVPVPRLAVQPGR